jgi:hypothetical protein
MHNRAVIQLLLVLCCFIFCSILSIPAEDLNYQCKDGAMPVPMPCADPSSLYKFPNKFYVGGWWPPAWNGTFDQFLAYKNAGFNMIMTDRHITVEQLDHNIRMIERLGGDMEIAIDTYIMNGETWTNDTWGGTYDAHPNHHPATQPELNFLLKRYGNHPQMRAILLGDDTCDMQLPQLENIVTMREQAPHLIPWINQICTVPGWNSRVHLPFLSYEDYASNMPEGQRVAAQTSLFWHHRNAARKSMQRYWPMTMTCDLDNPSFIMYGASSYYFNTYASLAYGAQGVWLFLFNDCMLDLETGKIVPYVYYPNAKANAAAAFWGQNYLLGRTAEQVFHSAGDVRVSHQYDPQLGYLIEHMDDHLLCGILPKYDNQQPLSVVAMVVDKRTDYLKDVPRRNVTIQFAPIVTQIHVIYTDGTLLKIRGSRVTLNLEGGEGQLLEIFDDEQGRAIQSLLYKTGRWQFSPQFYALTLPDSFNWYNEYFSWRQSSTFVLSASHGPMSTDADYYRYAHMDFTVVTNPSGLLPYDGLNYGVKYGIFMIANPGKPITHVKELQSFLQSVRCHTRLAGIELAYPTNEVEYNNLLEAVEFLRLNGSLWVPMVMVCKID